MATALREESATSFTPEDLLRLPEAGALELVDGRILEHDVSALSSHVTLLLERILGNAIVPAGLGWLFGPECGYQCFPDDPDRVRKPDISFVRHDRLSAAEMRQAGHLSLAPDLAVEVVSRRDTYAEVLNKAGEYLSAGTALVWVVEPETGQIIVHRADGSMSRLTRSDDLSGESVIPGFRCPVAELFPPE